VSRRVLVIGAGMAGLRVASLLASAGDSVTVVDKGRRHGGRMATRRVDDAVFDTGVLTFAARGDAFRAALTGWAREGHAEPTGEDGRWRGRPTMRALPTALSERCDAEIRLATTVTALAVSDGRWRATLREGDTVTSRDADALVLTAPAPQQVALLRSAPGLASDATLDLLGSVRYEPSLTVLARPLADAEGSRAQPARGPDGPIARIHQNGRTGASPVPALTLHGDLASSAAALDGDRDAAARTIVEKASEVLGITLVAVHVHAWRYAQVAQGIDRPALRDDTSGAPLVLAGDLFTSHGDGETDRRPEGVECAFGSAGAAARLLADH
jgi:renalase